MHSFEHAGWQLMWGNLAVFALVSAVMLALGLDPMIG